MYGVWFILKYIIYFLIFLIILATTILALSALRFKLKEMKGIYEKEIEIELSKDYNTDNVNLKEKQEEKGQVNNSEVESNEPEVAKKDD